MDATLASDSPAPTPRENSAGGVYRHVIDRITEGRLKPGARVRETALAEATGVSRTPVREAMRRLESEGLLVHEPHRGMVVRRLDHQEVTELYLMRAVLEGTAAGLAARHASDAEIAALREMVGPAASHGVEAVALARSNKLFHRALYRGAHNRYLLAMLDQLTTAMLLLGRTTLGLPGRADEATVEHAEIVDAIARHDPDDAEAAARRHIEAAHKARLAILFEDDMIGCRD